MRTNNTFPPKPTMSQVFEIFQSHQGEWLTANDISKILIKPTPSEVGGYIRILSGEIDGFERRVDGSHRRYYRYTEVSAA